MSEPTVGDRPSRRGPWRLLLPGIVLGVFWLVMMVLLAQREFGGQWLDAAATAGPPMAGDAWFGVYVSRADSSAEGSDREQPIGRVHISSAPEARGGVPGQRLRLSTRMALQLLGSDTDLDLMALLWRAADGSTAEIEATVRSQAQEFRLIASIEGGQLTGHVESAGERLPLSLPVPEGALVLDSGFGSALSFPQLEVGDDVRIDTFDPLTFSRRPTRVRCVAEATLRIGEQSIATKVLEVAAMGMTSRAWVDGEGQVVRAETPLGLTLERLAAGELEETWPAGDGSASSDLLAMTAVRANGEKPVRGARALTIEVSGIDLQMVPTDDAQRWLEPGRLRIEMPPSDGQTTSDSLDDSERFLQSDPFVQSDHAAIRRQSADIVDGIEDPWQRALAVHRWVYAEIDKVPVVSVPSALAVLEDRRGDCNEHTVLFTALARAAGLPTRIAIGLVWSDELDGFYYHAWPETHVAGAWHRLDPTLDQVPADATHIKLLEGGIETWPRLLVFLGQLAIRVEQVAVGEIEVE